LLTGDAAATDPVCHLSPQHGIVLDAVAAAEQGTDPLVYRDQKNSERLLARL
jgi:pyrroloquinoline quinone biosynthesis protein E